MSVKRPKIIFVNRFFYPDESATSQLLSDLAFFLAESGEDVFVVTSKQAYTDSRAGLPRKQRTRGVYVRRLSTTRFGRMNLLGRAFDYLSFYVRAAFVVARVARREDIVVAKTDPPLLGVVLGWAARSRRAQLVNWLQDVFPEVGERLGIRVFQGNINKPLVFLRDASLRQARCNVVLGRSMQEYVGARVAPTGAVPVVINNWADGGAINPVAAQDNALRKQWGLEDKFVLGYSGNFGRAHDVDTILQAGERLRERDDIVFLWVGGGARLEYLRAQANARGLRNWIFKPYQPRAKLGESLSVADVHIVSLLPELEGLIVPSKFSGIAAVGRPTLFVGSAQGEIGSLITANNCGWIVAPGQARQFADIVLDAAGNQAQCAAMGSRARALFDTCFARDAALDKWVDVFSDIRGASTIS